jgi:deferrochelatase/peroxidase EfeB
LPPAGRPTRRGLVCAAAGLAAAAGMGSGGRAEARIEAEPGGSATDLIEPFWGAHQGGITTPAQTHTYTAALDLVSPKRDDLIRLLRVWTTAAASMSAGQPVQADVAPALPDSGEATGLPIARLTVTFGFGAGLAHEDRSRI